MTNIFTRSKLNPILKPFPSHKWENLKAYNPGAIFHKDKHHLFYRAVGKGKNWHSSIGYASSTDGETFTRYACPLLSPEGAKEKRGLEDPRITQVGNKFYMTYTAFDSHIARLSLAASKDLMNWKRIGEIFPNWDSKRAGEFLVPWDKAQHNKEAKHHWLKAGAIFEEKINGLYHMIFGDRLLWTATSKNGTSWTPEYEPWLTPRLDYFDNAHIEMGPPPIRTNKGWLVIYHGIDNTASYRLGWLLLDLRNPKKIIKRSNKSIFEPSAKYELLTNTDIRNKDTEPKVVYCNGAVKIKDKIRIYYGASDSVICTATAKIKDILKAS